MPELGAYAGVDANTAKRFKRGELPFYATLDLHGMHREAAHDALRSAVEDAYHEGGRCLLVITGKGRAGEGVLRGSLSGWLNDAPLKRYVLVFDVAQPRHGGQGAFYVLVKRKRVSDAG